MLLKYFGELLPALEIMPDNESEIEIKQLVTVPEIRNLTVKEAIEKLKEVGLDFTINTEKEINKDETLVTQQLPKPGITIKEGIQVEIYVE